MNLPMTQIQMADRGSELEGVCLLVVEDDYLVAADLCNALQRRGACILGPVNNVSRGEELARQQRPDVVLLDINLNGELVFGLAGELRDAGIRTIFTTGYDSEFVPEHLRSTPCLQKPVNLYELVRLISAAAPPDRLVCR